MATTKGIMGSGIAGLAAQHILGVVSKAQAATGATQGAQTLPTSIVEFSTSTLNYGPTLSATAAPGDIFLVANTSANTIKVWPASGFNINGGSADAALTIPTLKTATFTSLGNGNWVSVLSA